MIDEEPPEPTPDPVDESAMTDEEYMAQTTPQLRAIARPAQPPMTRAEWDARINAKLIEMGEEPDTSIDRPTPEFLAWWSSDEPGPPPGHEDKYPPGDFDGEADFGDEEEGE